MKVINHHKVDKIDECLLAHVNHEANKHRIAILEKHGYYADIFSITRPFYFNILKYGDDIVLKGNKTFMYDDMSIFKGVCVFFSGFSVTIYAELNEKVKNTISDGGYDEDSKMYFKNDNIEFHPEITISVVGSNTRNILNSIMVSLGHEFTHAYTDYMIFKNSGGKKRLKDIYDPSIINSWIDSDSDDEFDKRFAEIFYVLNSYEQNAYIAELRQNIENYPFELKTSIDLTKAIQSTESYNKLLKIIKLISTIKNEKWSFLAQDSIVNSINYFSGKKFDSFEGSMNFVEKIARTVKRKFDSTSSKIAYDVFAEKQLKGKIIDKEISGGDEFFRKLREE